MIWLSALPRTHKATGKRQQDRQRPRAYKRYIGDHHADTRQSGLHEGHSQHSGGHTAHGLGCELIVFPTANLTEDPPRDQTHTLRASLGVGQKDSRDQNGKDELERLTSRACYRPDDAADNTSHLVAVFVEK